MQQVPLAERMRPRHLQDIIGQEHLTGEGSVLRRSVQSGHLPSMIFWGPPGVGKTTLANAVASDAGRPFFQLSAISSGVKEIREVIAKAEQLKGAVLFIDEIHQLSRVVEESLYPAMEDQRIDIMIDSGPNARSIQLTLNRFTLIGATTRSGLLTAPLLSDRKSTRLNSSHSSVSRMPSSA